MRIMYYFHMESGMSASHNSKMVLVQVPAKVLDLLLTCPLMINFTTVLRVAHLVVHMDLSMVHPCAVEVVDEGMKDLRVSHFS